MRAVTIAAAGAALLTSVSASSHVKMMHARLHQRDDMGDWASSTAVDPTTTTSDDWPTVTSSADLPVDPTTSEEASVTWEDWSTSEDPATTTSTSETWTDDWSSTSVDPTTSTSSTESWGDWSSTSVDPETTSTSESWGDWSSTSVDPTTSTSESWGDWPSTTDPATSTTESWGDWSSSVTDPATSTESWEDWGSTLTVSSTTTTTITVAYASSTAWGDWDSTTTVPATSTVTSSVAAGWSSDGWFGPAWNTEVDACAMNVVSSYGAPTWYPTPEAPTSTPAMTLTVTPTPAEADSSASTSWADWSSSDSVDPTSSTAWADWSSTESADPTTSTAWADWSSSESADPTTSTAWADWSSSDSATATATGSGWSSTATGISSNGNSWGMTYSPYTGAGGCKDASTVAGDLAKIKSKGFTTVRVYSTDCQTLDHVGKAARDNGLKLILGVFISSTGINGAKGQVTDITAWAQWDLVELIVVGNEATFNGYTTASELAGFISSSAWAFKAAGYTGPVTTTEPLDTWTSQGTAFCDVIDVVAANLYAFFNAQTTADKAGDFIQAEIEELSAICPGKETYVMESGWPSAGSCNGAACPSPENQATALKSIQAITGAKVIFFSFEDESWKQPGQFGVEQHWGCSDVF